MPETWSRLFTSDPAVIAASAAYITHVAPFYCLFGLGLTLYFASQGAGRMTVPVVAGVVRMVAATAAAGSPSRSWAWVSRACSPRLPSAWRSMAA